MVKKSARKDKNDRIDNITKEIEKANKTGKLREVYRLTNLTVNPLCQLELSTFLVVK